MLDLDLERETAIQLAREAGRMALAMVSRPLRVEDKGSDLGPVTEVDRELDRFLTRELSRRFPADLVVSEESEAPEPGPAERVWYVDPIDGTEELVGGRNEWSILIGLALRQRPVVGVVYRPETRELFYAAAGRGAFRQSEPAVRLQVNAVSDPSKAVLVVSRSHPSRKVERVAETLGIRRTFRLGSLGLKAAKIAEGEADLYLNFSGKCHFWDLCAPEILLLEAGGEVQSLRGAPIRYGLEGTSLRYPFVCAARGLMPHVVRASAGMEVDAS